MKDAVRYSGSAGFILLEVMVVTIMIGIGSVVVMPSVMKFYRETAIEYEAEHLLADIRRTQSLSRLAVTKAWGYGATEPVGQLVRLYVDADESSLEVRSHGGVSETHHRYLPLVHVRREWQGGSGGSGPIAFTVNGSLKEIGTGMMTLVIDCDGSKREGRKIMISKGGRIRLERVMR